ncbi:Histone-lysine N-methyltransferase [Handroanthus impetiginosus]|uniref:RING-type E3 ubiquitin transferase n=1 Tax=Handroanthus impetiginosus TaxID=429701 RepID=A0A2G9GKP8_9LAMI|nr:Histone-lysine N-methyltransferase [Handroanthus impetiginosus]
MLCKEKPAEETTLTCITCATPWHVSCLSVLPETMASALNFECPDCSGDGLDGAQAPADTKQKDLLARIREIEADDSLSEKEKAKRRQQLMSGKVEGDEDSRGNGEIDEEKQEKVSDILGVLGESFKCSYCMELPERPVTTPCGHNFCLKCFEKWIKQGNYTCVKCRGSIPRKMAMQPRINPTLVAAIRMAKLSRSIASGGPPKIVYQFLHNQDRPDRAFTTERAQKPGMANAASGRIFVTVPKDHFGPIPAENDPVRNQGVLVGETWDMRMDCRQWGVHYPPVAGICGRAHYGAQSVVISGGYEDDEDHGEWFIYTGSGGRDLSGNKRTNKEQSFDQEFKEQNQALRVSCNKGYPVRVVRSEKDKRSSYAPEKGYRYDGIYRIEKCWRKLGKQGFKVCRYFFVRCDNEPAPWTSDEHGDRPRCLPVIPELRQAIDVSERKDSPSWDYDEEECCWKWKRPPPPSEEKVVHVDPKDVENARKVIRKAQTVSVKEKLLKGFRCLICEKVMNLPLTTPCAHNFCKHCLENAFAGQTSKKDRVCQNGRKLRSQKNVLKCPACPTDISEFLQNPQVNREIMEVIEKLQAEVDMDGNDDKGSATEEINTGKGNHDDGAVPGGDDAVNLSNEEEAERHHESSLKRKSDSPSLSADESENREAPKKSKVDDADDPESKGDKSSVLQSPVARGRGRPKGKAQKGAPKFNARAKVKKDDGEQAVEIGNASP